MNEKKIWADEPTPLCNNALIYADDGEAVRADRARDLEQRLRHANRLLQEVADECCGCSFDDCLHERTRVFLEEQS